jgi:hypothetical protein
MFFSKLVPLLNIKIAGKWMFIPLKMVLIGIDPYPNGFCQIGFFMFLHHFPKYKSGVPYVWTERNGFPKAA